ncbi:dTDP-4-dehydrorhamnose reductase [Pseudonocardia thermophila]|uniref:dTDP-4-dehydrorhamnose reductase n=1 Tax=Pseudonocardia thermophila TaxID=1848 RepID=A0A1M6SPW7_PSETH|nr:dTDP-4-dehydrorhamnose reductase [Pseudonocardia thermophila]SHK46696.1 dTDP-4-dehydrorhamnose reductase [Pseudonocardia thermophila]
MSRTLLIGATGQVGRALAARWPDAATPTRAELDLADLAGVDVSGYDVIVNAAAWTAVDAAETPDGRRAAWQANAAGPAELARLADRHGCLLVHLSTEYVFDGRSPRPYREDDPVAPLSVYGASKAAGDLAVATAERHLIVRPTWVVGDGHNFVRTMVGLAERGIAPTVVADQIGRPTFAEDLADAIVHLLDLGATGTFHVTGGGEPVSWADVARAVFAIVRPDLTVTDTTTAAYFADKPGAAARPLNSVLALDKAEAAGVRCPDWRESLARYLA